MMMMIMNESVSYKVFLFCEDFAMRDDVYLTKMNGWMNA